MPGYNHKLNYPTPDVDASTLAAKRKKRFKVKVENKIREKQKEMKANNEYKADMGMTPAARLQNMVQISVCMYVCMHVCRYVCLCVWRCNNLCASVWPHVIQTCTMCAMHVRTCPSRASCGSYFGRDCDADCVRGCAVDGNACRCTKLTLFVADAKQRRRQRCRRRRRRRLSTT